MNKSGYIDYHGVESIFFLEEKVLYIIPKESDDITKLRKYFYDENFFVRFGNKFFTNIAHVKESSYDDGRIKLIIDYVFDRCICDSFSKIEITGDALDIFFNPAHYFYRKDRDERNAVDYMYHNEEADKWEVTFRGKTLTISLLFGDILSRGGASDLMLHPKLRVEFENTDDVAYVFSVYQMILRFLKIIRYDVKCGKLLVDLVGIKDEKISHNGYLCDYTGVQEPITYIGYNIEYMKLKPYIGKMLQFAAENEGYSFKHFPKDGIRYRGIHYTGTDFVNIFSAFENECRADSSLYEKVDTSRIQDIKKNALERVEVLLTNELREDEQNFLDEVISRINQAGTQFGQAKKIQQAYDVLHAALDDSIERIFYRTKIKGKLSVEELERISKYLTKVRGKVSHGANIDDFSDDDVQSIKFLEILTYAMLLKRAGLDDLDIEKVIGAVFGCNFKIDVE